MAESNRIHINRISVKNYKQIGAKAVVIDVKGRVHQIKGDADQGKTSIVDALYSAFQGIDPEYIHGDAEKSEIGITLDVATINRIMDVDGKEILMVKDSDGKRMKEAKKWLKTIFHPSTFRPLQFVQLGCGEKSGKTARLRLQRQMLLEALSVQLSDDYVIEAVAALGTPQLEMLNELKMKDIDFQQNAFEVCKALEDKFFNYRSIINSRLEEAENYLELAPKPKIVAPEKPVEECEQAVKEAEEAYMEAYASTNNRQNTHCEIARIEKELAEEGELPSRKKAEEGLDKRNKQLSEVEENIIELKEALEEARKQKEEIETAIGKYKSLRRKLDAREAKLLDLEKLKASVDDSAAEIDVEGLKASLDEAKALCEARKLQDEHNTRAKKVSSHRAKSDVLTALVELFRDRLPLNLIEQADLGIEGLSMDKEKILVNGNPMHLLGTSKQFRIAVKMAAALNPVAGWICVDGAESIGQEDLQAIAQIAEEMDLQLFETFVDPEAEPDENTTVMKHGRKME